MELTVYRTENTSILRVIGSISQIDVYRFSRALRDLEQTDCRHIAIDISGVEYVESHALGILVSHYMSLQREGRELFLINSKSDPYCYMTKLLQTTRLDQMIRVVNPS